MDRYRTPGPRDNTTSPAGDGAFMGVWMLAPEKIPPGFVQSAENCVFDDRAAATRPGKRMPLWLNQVLDGVLMPWDTIHGFDRFRDPNGREWGIIAADGRVYRAVENNSLFAMSLPAGCVIVGPVNFLQAFNVMLLQQGERLPTLVLTDIGGSWALQVADWNPATAYAEGAQVAYGTEVAVDAIALAGNVATVTTDGAHSFETGDRVYIYFETRPELATAFSVTVTGIDTFTFEFSSLGSAIAPADVTSITLAATTATVTTTLPHGLVTGRRVVISGAGEPEYNIEAAVTVTGASTFTYEIVGAPASPATGTITWLPVVYASRQIKFFEAKVGGTAAGESPITTPSKWTALNASSVLADSQIAPWTLGALFLQNRIFYPFDKDLVAASNTQAYVDIEAQKETLRINQGDADKLVALEALNKRTFLAAKRGALYIIGSVYGDLLNVTQERLKTSYGLAARRCVTPVGNDLWILTGEPAVRSFYVSQQNEVLGRDAAMSLPIEPLMRRINPLYLSEACAVFVNGKYHLGVALDDARSYGAEILYSNGKAIAGAPVNLDLPIGVTFLYYANEADDSSLYNNGERVSRGSYFTVAGKVQIRARAGLTFNYDLTLQRVYVGNNAILTYNTKNEAWEGVHQGEGICPVEFKVLTLNGRDRVFFASADGFINLWGEGRGDQVFDLAEAGGYTLRDIESEVVSRGFDYQVAGLKHFSHLRWAVSTWAPTYSMSARFDGVNEEQVLAEGVTKSRRNYFDPYGRPPFVLDNRNLDHGDPGREDYSVALEGEEGIHAEGEGVDFEHDQESSEEERISHGRRDRVAQSIFRNTTGFAQLNAVEFSGEAGERTSGVHQ